MAHIKTLTAVAALTVGALGFAPSAFAWGPGGNCGYNYHRNSWGECVPNYHPGPRPGPCHGYGYCPVRGSDDIRIHVPGVNINIRTY